MQALCRKYSSCFGSVLSRPTPKAAAEKATAKAATAAKEAEAAKAAAKAAATAVKEAEGVVEAASACVMSAAGGLDRASKKVKELTERIESQDVPEMCKTKRRAKIAVVFIALLVLAVGVIYCRHGVKLDNPLLEASAVASVIFLCWQGRKIQKAQKKYEEASSSLCKAKNEKIVATAKLQKADQNVTQKDTMRQSASAEAYYANINATAKAATAATAATAALFAEEVVFPKRTSPKWRGKELGLCPEMTREYSDGRVSGKKITLESTDKSESFTFNTAVDDFYKVGDYVVINRKECEERSIYNKNGTKPDKPDGRTVILGIEKFEEILGEAGDPEVKYKSKTGMKGEYGPKEVVEKIGPQIFQERGFFLINTIDIGLPMEELDCVQGEYDGRKYYKENLPLKQGAKEVGGLIGRLLERGVSFCHVRNQVNGGTVHSLHYDGPSVTGLCCMDAEKNDRSDGLPETQWGRTPDGCKMRHTGGVKHAEEAVLKKFTPDVSIALKKGDILYFKNKGEQNPDGSCDVAGWHRVLWGGAAIRKLAIVFLER